MMIGDRQRHCHLTVGLLPELMAQRIDPADLPDKNAPQPSNVPRGGRSFGPFADRAVA
jgi:hypothetical protein